MSIRSTLPASVPRHGRYAAPIPEQGICWAGSAASVKTVNLALQGGGAHGAFAWGVRGRLRLGKESSVDVRAQYLWR
jgi:predicted acylesterase/phospholipase RssA